MRGAPTAAVTALALLAAACGSGATTAHTVPPSGTAPPAVSSGSSSARSTTVSVLFGSPVPATATTRATSTATAPPLPGATIAARPAAPAPAPGPCTTADLGITTTTDKQQYLPADYVEASVVVRNVSSRGCVFSVPGEFTIDTDSPPPSTPPTVFTVHLGCPSAGCAPLAPGQTSTYPIPPWNQVGNQGPWTGKAAPPGGYHARAAFSGYPVSTSAPFSLG
jgi:hypothetical protein